MTATNATTKAIVLGTDFSPGAELAEAKAVELARAFDAELHLVHGWTLPIVPSSFAMPDMNFDMAAAVQKVADDLMKKEVEKLKAAGLRVHGLVQMGEAWRLIVDTAKNVEASMIVMGTHGRRGLPRVLLGSVAEKVVRTAACPVLTVPMVDASLPAAAHAA